MKKVLNFNCLKHTCKLSFNTLHFSYVSFETPPDSTLKCQAAKPQQNLLRIKYGSTGICRAYLQLQQPKNCSNKCQVNLTFKTCNCQIQKNGKSVLAGYFQGRNTQKTLNKRIKNCGWSLVPPAYIKHQIQRIWRQILDVSDIPSCCETFFNDSVCLFA